MRVILLISFTILASTVRGQIIWGIKGGPNVSTLSTSAQYTPRLGYHLGMFYSQHLEEQYGWQVGLQYSLQGARDPAITNGRLNYHYLAMPLVLKFYISGMTYAEVGPQIAYLMKASYSETGYKEDRTDGIQRWDLLGLAGFGYETDSGTNMGLRFGVGFFNTSGASVGNAIVYRNLLFQAYVGIKIKEIE